MARSEDISAMEEILINYEIYENVETIEKIVDDFFGHIDAMKEMEMYQHLPSPRQKNSDVEKLEKRVEELEAQLRIYENHIAKKYSSDVYVGISRGEVTINHRPL